LLRTLISHLHHLGPLNDALKPFVQFFYVKIIPQVILVHIPEVTHVIPRHSVRSNAFNIFYSDLDLTLITDNIDSANLIYEKFFKLKKYFLFLDFPEIRTLSEELKLNEIKTAHGQLIDVIWHLRKTSWLHKKLVTTTDSFEVFKIRRALKRSYQIISPDLETSQTTQLSKINALGSLFPTTNDSDISTCLYSSYIPIGSHGGIVIETNSCDCHQFFMMLPGEAVLSGMSDDWMNAKRSLHQYEILLSKAQLRKEVYLGISSNLGGWIKSLEKFESDFL
jgi:hypothetical protein